MPKFNGQNKKRTDPRYFLHEQKEDLAEQGFLDALGRAFRQPKAQRGATPPMAGATSAPQPGAAGGKCLLPNLEEVPMRQPFKWEDGNWYMAVDQCTGRQVGRTQPRREREHWAHMRERARCKTNLVGARLAHIQAWAVSPEVTGARGGRYGGDPKTQYQMNAKLSFFSAEGKANDTVGGTWVDTGPMHRHSDAAGIEAHLRPAYCIAKQVERPERRRGRGARGDPRFCEKCRQACGDEPGHPPARGGIERVHGSPGVGSGLRGQQAVAPPERRPGHGRRGGHQDR